jgi:hypothetical protein
MKFSFSLVFFFLAGCVSLNPPLEEFTFARAALDSARAVEASRFSPGYWHQAEDAYRKAKILYNEREFIEAKAEFLKAKQAAEKAENSTRLIRLKNGEVL